MMTMWEGPLTREIPEQRAALSDMLEVGLTFRRLDYWTRKGYLVADQREDEKGGSGYPRSWSLDEMAVARGIYRLTEAGFVLAAAARLAREQYEGRSLLCEVGSGILLALPADIWAPDGSY